MEFVEQIRRFTPSDDIQREHKKLILSYIEIFSKRVLYRSASVAHMTSSAVILNEKRDKMLMIHHNIYNTWTWTGGHTDGDENLAKVALKEAQEETGLTSLRFLTEDIVRVDPLPVYGHYKNGQYVSTHLHLNASYVLIADENEALRIKPDENSDICWVAIDEIEHYSNEPEFVSLYLDIIQKIKHIK